VTKTTATAAQVQAEQNDYAGASFPHGDASLEQMSGQKGTASGREAQSVGHQWWAGGKEQRMFQREAG
jgi:hypothetical protein